MNNTSKKISKRRPTVNHNLSKVSVIENTGKDLDETPQRQQNCEVEFYHRKAYEFCKTFKNDYRDLRLIYNFCIKAEQERERQNNEEVDQLKLMYNQMQAEITNMKREVWCRYCESEATYLSSTSTNLYCSTECEQKQNELVSAIDDFFF